LADSSLLAQIQMCQHVFQTKLGQRTIEAMQLITLRPGGYDSQLGGGNRKTWCESSGIFFSYLNN